MKHTAFVFMMVLGIAGCGEAPVAGVPPTRATIPAVEITSDKDPIATDSVATSETPSESAAEKDADAREEEAKPVKDTVVRTEEEWKALLTPEQYYVLREKGTERPFQNEFDHHFEPGTYACAACGQELFDSDTKFNSGCGWPAFYAAKAGDHVTLTPDNSLGMIRTEVTCSRCGSHLGHIFDDAPQTPTGQRYCINSVSLKFIPAAESDEAEDGADEE
jgi:peptide-methionine (R)-S-oxide reductase